MALLPISYFLWNWSSCETVSLRNHSTGQCSPSSKGCHGHSVSQKKIRRVFFKLWGSNLSQLFKIYFKEVILELLAPICKREKCGIHSHGFFPPEASLPALDGGVDRLSTEAFFPWLNLVCPLPTQVPYLSLLGLPPRCGGDAPGVDLMASQIDVHFLTIKTYV